MKPFLPSLSAFALAGLTVTSTTAGQQDECLRKLATEWDKNATFLAARPTIMGNASMALATPKGIVVVNSEFSSAHFYDGDESPISPEQISIVGTLEDRKPNRVETITDGQRKLQPTIAACLKLEK